MDTAQPFSPQVSFCFSTFKRGIILKNTLETVRRQTYGNFEVIVSDNDPEGSGRPFVEAMNDSRFKYFNNGANLGMKPSFNKSLERSSGEFVVMIADDDPVYPEMLMTLVKLHNEFPDYGMYMGGCDWFCENSEVAKLCHLHVGTNSCISDEHDLNYVQEFTTADFIKTLFSFGIFSHFLWSTCMVRRDLLIKVGGVPDYGTPFLGDFAFMSVSATQKGCVIINNAIGCQTMHKENFGRNQNEQLPILAKNFPAYLDDKLGYLLEWDTIRPVIMRFLGLWITGHMAFLHHYYKINKLPDNGLQDAERRTMQFDYIAKFRFKYLLKKKFPRIHDSIVSAKKTLKGLLSS